MKHALCTSHIRIIPKPARFGGKSDICAFAFRLTPRLFYLQVRNINVKIDNINTNIDIINTLP